MKIIKKSEGLHRKLLSNDFFMYGDWNDYMDKTIHIVPLRTNSTLCGKVLIDRNCAATKEVKIISCPNCLKKYSTN